MTCRCWTKHLASQCLSLLQYVGQLRGDLRVSAQQDIQVLLNSPNVLFDKGLVFFEASFEFRVLFFLPFSPSLDEVQELQILSPEELVLEINVLSIFANFAHFLESVHVELPDEALKLLVPEISGQYQVLQSFLVLDFYLSSSARPTDDVGEVCILEDGVELENEFRNILLLSVQGFQIETGHLKQYLGIHECINKLSDRSIITDKLENWAAQSLQKPQILSPYP